MATVETRIDGSVTVFELGGTLTIDHGPIGLKGEVASALAAGVRAFVVNVSRVASIDSYGVAELASCHTAVTRRGGRVIFCELSAKMRDILIITRLNTVFETRDSEADAVAALAR